MLKTDVFASRDSDRDMTRVRRIGFLVFSDAEALDVCGPLGVFANADYQLRAGGRTGERGYEVLVIAAAAGPVRTQSGLQIVATHSCDDVSFRLDTLIVAGGIGVEAASADPMLVAWLQAAAPRVRRLASVCSGAFLLAAAGLLDDRRITTHWMFCDRLAELYPSLRIDPDLIFVRDGHVYTSGGVTSGIDLALALVEEDLGREIAMQVARIMVVFLRRPGGQTQFSPFLYAEARTSRDIRELQTWILAHPAERLDVATLADRLAMSPRNFARHFRSETGVTPAKFVEQARVEIRPLPAGADRAGGGRHRRRVRLRHRGADAPLVPPGAERRPARLSGAVPVHRRPVGGAGVKAVAARPPIHLGLLGQGAPLRGLRERVLQTVAFEAGGLVIAAPLYAAAFGAALDDSVVLLGALAVACLIWCPLHNTAFDWLESRLARRTASDRPHRWRAVHALSHEVSVAVVTLPLLMRLGGLGFAEAISADIGLTLFYAGYAYLFHLAFDRLRPVEPAP